MALSHARGTDQRKGPESPGRRAFGAGLLALGFVGAGSDVKAQPVILASAEKEAIIEASITSPNGVVPDDMLPEFGTVIDQQTSDILRRGRVLVESGADFPRRARSGFSTMLGRDGLRTAHYIRTDMIADRLRALVGSDHQTPEYAREEVSLSEPRKRVIELVRDNRLSVMQPGRTIASITLGE